MPKQVLFSVLLQQVLYKIGLTFLTRTLVQRKPSGHYLEWRVKQRETHPPVNSSVVKLPPCNLAMDKACIKWIYACYSAAVWIIAYVSFTIALTKSLILSFQKSTKTEPSQRNLTGTFSLM